MECRLNFKNRPERTRDLKGVLNEPLPLIGVARSLPLIGLINYYPSVTCSHLSPALTPAVVTGLGAPMRTYTYCGPGHLTGHDWTSAS